jgi:hypothetical protein
MYPHIKETQNGADCDLADILECVRAGKWKEKIEALQQKIKDGATPKAIETLKTKLPYFAGSGTFSVRNNDGLKVHSGKLIIDFDKLENLQETREKLTSDKYSEYVFHSCTGRGLAVVVSIDPLKHLESFLFLEKYYSTTYGLTIDKSCKDVSRPRYISYDPDLYHNPDCAFVTLPSALIDGDEEKYNWVLNVHNKKESFIEGNRHHYLMVLAFFLNKCGVSQEYTTGKFLSDFTNEDKGTDEVTKIITYAYKNHLDFGTFAISKKTSDLPDEFSEGIKKIFAFAYKVNSSGRKYNDGDINSMCAEHLISKDAVRGIFEKVKRDAVDEWNLDSKPEIYKIELFIKKRYDIIKNEVSQQVEFKEKGTDKYENLNSDTINRELQYAQFKFPLDKIKSLMRSNYVAKYNPFVSYFESLPAWPDNGVDHITELADYVTTDNQKFWRIQFKKALVRSIACSVEHKENRIVMTMIGGNQETGKTSFIRFLCPPELKAYYTEAAMDGGKDSDIQLSENFMWNLEELSALSNIEVNKLKAIISKSIVKQRHSYDAHAQSNPRRVNFWASTNKDEFLTDDQNTRWVCFNVKSINHNYGNYKANIYEIDIKNVWAQAYALYHSGFDYTLSAEECAERDAINKMYELSSTEKNLILTYYKPCAAGQGNFMHTTDFLMELQKKTDNKVKINEYAIPKALKQIGFVQHVKKVSGRPVRGYWAALRGASPGQSEMNYDADPDAPKPF